MNQTPFLSDFHTSNVERPARKTSRRRNGKKKSSKDRSKSTKLVTLKDTANQIRLYAWHELESWQQDNEFLHSGYRKATNSYRASLTSLSYIHNQTANIYSHLVGAFLFILASIFIYYSVASRYSTADAWDVGIFASFFMGAMTCFGMSAFFHTVGNHSEKVYHSWLLMDLYGILGLICGTVYSGTYYGFYCERKIWLAYSIQITLITSLGALICAMPKFRAPKWRIARAVVFGFIFFSGAIPMTHAVKKFGYEKAAQQMGWWWLILEASLYVMGATIYAFRFPECIKPGAFDIWGNSHQVFHIFAVLGALVHLIGMIKAFDYNHNPATRRC
ncbi:hypothetical protein HYALB_00004349 [Hymenoscyphus albidus]|uniref:HlyIII-domain-containing protein n=1 Tax=Hymenoscyphus albidus TaxID=595503 RepID=A0A9N9Q2M1_9HELO|nr:hypothetical protein HYALB_00004349 [Hymenoscyphus albidus]